MPRSKNYLTYPEAFHSLLAEAATREIRVPCGTEKEARKLMGRLYSFHGALAKAAAEKSCTEEVRGLYHLSTKVQYRTEGPEFVARPQDMDPTAQRILAALGPTKTPTIETRLTPSADLLASLKKEDQHE